jgi:hypothetical protein
VCERKRHLDIMAQTFVRNPHFGTFSL